jgi:arginine repressor
MARGRLRAIDAMIEKLTMESAGKTVEELSDLLQQEGRVVTGALLGEVLRSCGGCRPRSPRANG